MAMLIIPNEEKVYIVKLVKSLKDTDFMIKDVSKTIKNEEKEQKGGFISI